MSSIFQQEPLSTILFQLKNNEVDNLFNEDNLSDSTVVINTSEPEQILQYKASKADESNESNKPKLILHSLSLNNVQHINTLLINTSQILPDGGYVICNCVTSDIIRDKIFSQFSRVIAAILYLFNFLTHRVLPKLTITKRLYYFITKGERRVLTRVETLGRFYRAGFDVIHEQIINDKFYIVAKKIKQPINDDKPSNGILIKLKRKGKNGKIIGVYKFRSMHAYSEYLQPYMLKKEGLSENGKFANDYRVNTVGKFLRKTWLDELPMLINWLKGDLKLVGIRPLSEHYFSLYSQELQQLRIQVKPGLIPPFYADMPKTLDEIQASEIRYIKAYLTHPLKTDWRYFWQCINNIIFKGKRSK